jgi:hypothetical protein
MAWRLVVNTKSEALPRMFKVKVTRAIDEGEDSIQLHPANPGMMLSRHPMNSEPFFDIPHSEWMAMVEEALELRERSD